MGWRALPSISETLHTLGRMCQTFSLYGSAKEEMETKAFVSCSGAPWLFGGGSSAGAEVRAARGVIADSEARLCGQMGALGTC